MQSERAKVILKELNKHGIVRVTELSQMLNCSEVTIRNDIRKLDKEGLLKRNHGGASKIGDQHSNKVSGKNINVNSEKKIAIAQKAYEYIKDNDTIIIDDSSTSFYLTKFIKEDPSKNIVVVTNSLLVATELADIEHVDLFIVGGQIERSMAGTLAATMGDMTIENLGSFFVDKAFIGVKGINLDVGITSLAYPQMQVKRAIIKSSKELYVLADSSKFGSAYLSVICPLDIVTKLITDSSVAPEIIKKAEGIGLPFVFCE